MSDASLNNHHTTTIDSQPAHYKTTPSEFKRVRTRSKSPAPVSSSNKKSGRKPKKAPLDVRAVAKEIEMEQEKILATLKRKQTSSRQLHERAASFDMGQQRQQQWRSNDKMSTI